MRLAKMMRIYIASEGLDQKTVAQECGVSETTLSRFLSGERLPEADAFMRLLSWCTSQAGGQAIERQKFDPNARIGGPDAPYRKKG